MFFCFSSQRFSPLNDFSVKRGSAPCLCPSMLQMTKKQLSTTKPLPRLSLHTLKLFFVICINLLKVCSNWILRFIKVRKPYMKVFFLFQILTLTNGKPKSAEESEVHYRGMFDLTDSSQHTLTTNNAKHSGEGHSLSMNAACRIEGLRSCFFGWRNAI